MEIFNRYLMLARSWVWAAIRSTFSMALFLITVSIGMSLNIVLTMAVVTVPLFFLFMASLFSKDGPVYLFLLSNMNTKISALMIGPAEKTLGFPFDRLLAVDITVLDITKLCSLFLATIVIYNFNSFVSILAEFMRGYRDIVVEVVRRLLPGYNDSVKDLTKELVPKEKFFQEYVALNIENIGFYFKSLWSFATKDYMVRSIKLFAYSLFFVFLLVLTMTVTRLDKIDVVNSYESKSYITSTINLHMNEKLVERTYVVSYDSDASAADVRVARSWLDRKVFDEGKIVPSLFASKPIVKALIEVLSDVKACSDKEPILVKLYGYASTLIPINSLDDLCDVEDTNLCIALYRANILKKQLDAGLVGKLVSVEVYEHTNKEAMDRTRHFVDTVRLGGSGVPTYSKEAGSLTRRVDVVLDDMRQCGPDNALAVKKERSSPPRLKSLNSDQALVGAVSPAALTE